MPPAASHDEIAHAYRRLAHDAHPDVHPEDPDAARRFREVTEAYEVLGNPDKRERYDRARRPRALGAGQAPGAAEGRTLGPRPTSSSPAPPGTGGPPVFLGTGPVNGLGPALFVGPVRAGPGPSASAPLGPHDFATALLERLLADILGSRWRP